MPGTYPAPPPTLSGDLETISRFLQSPTQIRRRLRNFLDLRFISDQILTQRFRSSGGAVLFEQSEPFVTDRTVEAVQPGAEYPYANTPTGTAAIAAVSKWGQDVELTDEELVRNVYAGAALDRKLRKVVNTVIKQVDTVTLAAIASAVTATRAVSNGAWATVGTANPFLDVQLAVADVHALNLGYTPDTLLMGDTKYAYFTANTVVVNALRRETTDNPIYTGQLQTLAGLKVIVSPNLPTADVWVVDSQQIGGMADEVDGAPGYSADQMGIEVKSIRNDKRDKWDLRGRRKTVPVVQETGAAIRITGT
ncbi:MAG TPA: hypothetical protein VJX66_32010 [Amycolatopsis sp.]|nr:hypothetical protein [Amycolatopsis sp.]